MHRPNVSSSKIVPLVLAALVLGAAATASARPKKDSAARASSPATLCHGTPMIMQGLDCPKYPARGEEQEHATERAKYPHVTARGSGSVYVAPLPRSPSPIPQPSAAPYIPPPISNPSERIMQLNQSFPLNGGLGNNPSDRDSYVRYNLTR
jgi:hypothetical protein